MDLVPIRELQQHASALLRRVRAGETLGITHRGTLVAVLGPPSGRRGAAALVASGRVRAASIDLSELPAPTTSGRSTAEVLEDLRADR
jgi:prevent-host-death family protein